MNPEEKQQESIPLTEDERQQILSALNEEIVTLRHNYLGMMAYCIFAAVAVMCFLIFCI